MKKLFLVTAIVLSVFLYKKCTWSSFYGDEDLGNGYVLWKDGGHQGITFSEEKPYTGNGGLDVISNHVQSIDYNNNYIIAKTNYNTGHLSDSTDYRIKYWIIDKTIQIGYDDFSVSSERINSKYIKSIVFQSDDSATFFNELKRRKIVLKFK
jgi:hypothetical protein